MKKIALSLLLLFVLLSIIRSQTVDSIKVEQAADLIKLHYKILNSTSHQIFKVTILCSINGGLKSELKSLSGDFGDNVIGGRSDYMVLWDVLKDVEEVRSVDFSVRAELLKDNTPISMDKPKIIWASKKTFILPSIGSGGGNTGQKYGIRLAYMGSWGVSGKLLFGTPNNHELEEDAFSIGFDLTKRIISSNGFQMYIMAGIEYAKLMVDPIIETQPGHYFDNFTTYEVGVIFAIKRIVLSFGYSHYNPSIESGFELNSNNHFNNGIGIRF